MFQFPHGVGNLLIAGDKAFHIGRADLGLIAGHFLIRQSQSLSLGQQVQKDSAVLSLIGSGITDVNDGVKVDGQHFFLLLLAGIFQQTVDIRGDTPQQFRDLLEIFLRLYLQFAQSGEHTGVYAAQIGEVTAIVPEPVLIAFLAELAAPVQKIIGILLFRCEQ